MKPLLFGLPILLTVSMFTAGCTNHKAEEEAQRARQERDAAIQQAQQAQRDKDAAIQKTQRDKDAAIQQAQRDEAAALQRAQRDKEYAEAQAAATAKVAAEQALPEVSVTLRWQKPDNGDSGYEAYIRNPYRDSVAVTFSVARPSSGNSKTYNEIVLDGSESVTLGEHNGWAFITGDTLTVTQPGHKPGMWTAP